ncbi:MAG: DNA cytosine methyltransferase, partial [Clostridia bacterium]|nr:DNA cytosine methyltransferase [Clostridia bacterium]
MNKTEVKGQISFLDEIIVDNFAGGGGASTGIELAMGRPVTIAINHDPAAILMHKTNHPYTEHLQDNVWNIDPKEICAGRPVGLAWFSPDCKHFSKAKGAALVDKNIRGLAWIVLKWAGTVRPRVIILENVEEFRTWGPVRKGKPIKSKSGQTFNKWISQLEALGYEIEYRELVAADYGAPTTRKRFVLIARCDGKPIVWPKRTHAPRDSEEVKSGKCKPWVSAAEIIDWDLPCPSIFETSAQIKDKYGLRAMRPLKDNTMRRIARGIDKFVIKSQKPFIVQVNHGGADRVSDAGQPLGTVTAKHGYGISDPILTPYALNHKFKNEPESIEKPLSTITAVNGHEIVQPVLAPLHMHNHSGASGTDIKDPINTITSTGAQMLITPHLSKYFGGVVGERADKPLPTITAVDHNAICAPTLIQYHAEQSEKEVRASGFEKPLMTVDGSGRYAVAAAHLTQYFKGDHYHSPDEPLHTVTTEIREGVTLAHLTEFKGQDIGQDVNNPLRTITASIGEFGAVYTRLEKVSEFIDLKFWPQVRDM